MRYLIGYILDHRQLLESSLPPLHILKMVNNISSEILKAVRAVDAELKARRTLLASRSVRPIFLTRSEIEHLKTLGEQRQW